MYQTTSWINRLYHLKELSPLETPVEDVFPQIDLLLAQAKTDWAIYFIKQVENQIEKEEKIDAQEADFIRLAIVRNLTEIYELFREMITYKEKSRPEHEMKSAQEVFQTYSRLSGKENKFVQKLAQRLWELYQLDKTFIRSETLDILASVLVKLKNCNGKLCCVKKYEAIEQEKVSLFVESVLRVLCLFADKKKADELRQSICYQYIASEPAQKKLLPWLHVEYQDSQDSLGQIFIHIRDVKLTHLTHSELLDERLPIETEVIFENCVFEGEIQTPFMSERKEITVSYLNCQFNGPVLIGNKASLVFYNCSFLNTVMLAEKELTDAIVFDKCVFEETSAFKMVNCTEAEKDTTSISHLRQFFIGETHDTPNQTELVLTDCIFKGNADFSNSHLPNQSKLKHLSFFGEANFNHTIFSKEVILEDFAFPAMENARTKVSKNTLETALKESNVYNKLFEEKEVVQPADIGAYEAQLKRGFLEVKWAAYHIGMNKRTLDNLRTKDRRNGITDKSIPFTLKTGNVYYHLDVLEAYKECESNADFKPFKAYQEKYNREWQQALNKNKRGSK